jgi:ERCC4-related helicase
MHRADYLKQVHLPVIEQIIYERSEGEIPPLLRKLLMSYSNIDIEWDPYVIKLRKSSLAADSQRLNKVYMTKKTHCREHIKGLVNTALSLNKELGQWASTNYIRSCISRAQGQAQNALVRFTSLADEEKIYLSDFLQKLEPSNVIHVQDISPDQASPKVHQLIKALTNEVDKEFAGIVFVETRASVKLLAQLLSMHPQTKNLFQIGTFVGMSNNSQRKLKLLDLPNDDDQSETLNDLKNGTKNLIISTSVLEEGIDVSACNFVACFQLPPNLKSFIQRRGRARARESKYILMIEEGTAASAETWEDLEHAMKQQYLNDARKLDDIRRQEEEVDEEDRCFSVKSTG